MRDDLDDHSVSTAGDESHLRCISDLELRGRLSLNFGSWYVKRLWEIFIVVETWRNPNDNTLT